MLRIRLRAFFAAVLLPGLVLVLGGATSCKESPPTAPARLRLLSVREYTNATRDLFDITPQGIVGDPYRTDYDNGPVYLRMDAEQTLAAEREAALTAAAVVASKLERVSAGCDPKLEGNDACRERILTHFLPRVYRRPLRDAELTRLRTLFDRALVLGDYPIAVQTLLGVALQSPAFLYRSEGGRNGATVLDPFERAAALSFFLTGSIPDAALFDAAAGGRLRTAAELRYEARRLLRSERGQLQLREFLHQWLATGRLPLAAKDPKVYPAFGPAVLSMRDELDRFFAAILSSRAGSLRDLFTSNLSYLDEQLALLYGVPYFGPGVQAVALDEKTRGGVLTRLGYLAVHAAPDQSNPVERGLFVRNALLCLSLPPPPPGINRAISKDSAKTTRSRFALHDQNPTCQTCHAAIDGIGFGFEQFDGIGVYRELENGAPVDTSGVLRDAGDEADGPFSGVVELEQHLLRSPRFLPCFVKQVYRFAMGAAESDAEAEELSALAKNFTVDSPISEIFVEIAASQAFQERVLP